MVLTVQNAPQLPPITHENFFKLINLKPCEKIACRILANCITTINAFFQMSRVNKRFHALARSDDVIRTLFSRSIFELWPSRYPMPQTCPKGKVVSYEHPHLHKQDIVSDTIKFLSVYGKNIKDLSVVIKCSDLFLDDTLIDKLLRTAQGISELYLGDYFPSDDCSSHPTDHLEGITDRGLANIGLCTDLRSLALKVRCRQISAVSFERLRSCTRLQSLAVVIQDRYNQNREKNDLEKGEKIGLEDSELNKIGTLTSLRELEVSLYKNSEASLMGLTRLTNLRQFTMHNGSNEYWKIGNNSIFRALGILTNLTDVSLERIRNTDEGSLQRLTSLPKLQRLKISDLDLTPQGLTCISLCSSLKYLELESLYFKIEDLDPKKLLQSWKETLTYVAACPVLKSLKFEIQSCQLEVTEAHVLTDILDNSKTLSSVVILCLRQMNPTCAWKWETFDQGYKRNEQGKLELEWAKNSY